MSSGIKLWEANSFDRFQYQYGDSSVPPEYHRSYTITIESNQLLFVVDSYGDILLEQTLDISEDFQDEIVSLLRSYEIKSKEKTSSDGCAGGTTKHIRLFKKGKVVFEGGLYFCAGEEFGNIGGDLTGFANSILMKFLPDYLKRIREIEK